MTELWLNSNDEDQMLNFWLSRPGLTQEYGTGVVTQGPCLKCALRNGVHEFFGGGSNPEFSKDVAERFAAGKQARVIPPYLLNFLLMQNDFSATHVSHVAHVNTPGIVVMGMLGKLEKPAAFAFLIDGTHRAVASLRAGRDFRARILTAKETMRCAQASAELKKQVVLIDPSPRAAKKTAQISA